MNAETEAMLNRAWEDAWMKIQEDNSGGGCRIATAPIDTAVESLAKRFKSTLSEDQARAFQMLMDLRSDVDVSLCVVVEDHYFQLGCLAGSGKMDQVPELLTEYPKKEAQEVAGILIRGDHGIKERIDELDKVLAT